MTEEIIISRDSKVINIPEYCYDCTLRVDINDCMNIESYCRLDSHRVDIMGPKTSKCILDDDERECLNGRFLVESVIIE